MKRLCLALALVAAGCSAVMVRRAPSEPEPARWPRCTEHKLFPLVDTAYAVLATAMTVTALNSDDQFAGLGAIVGVPMALGFGGSAVYGWSSTSRCVRVREAYERAALEGR